MGKVERHTPSIIFRLPAAVFRMRPGVIVGAGIIPLATVLTFLFLGEKSLWYDEAFSVNAAQMEWASLWHVISEFEANQGFYYILLHLWINLGQSEFVLRSLSAIFAISTVGLVYLLGTRLFGARVGLVAALLITLNSFFIAYAQEARAYMLVLLLATLSS
jgi:mannosyltransferase